MDGATAIDETSDDGWLRLLTLRQDIVVTDQGEFSIRTLGQVLPEAVITASYRFAPAVLFYGTPPDRPDAKWTPLACIQHAHTSIQHWVVVPVSRVDGDTTLSSAPLPLPPPSPAPPTPMPMPVVSCAPSLMAPAHQVTSEHRLEIRPRMTFHPLHSLNDSVRDLTAATKPPSRHDVLNLLLNVLVHTDAHSASASVSSNPPVSMFIDHKCTRADSLLQPSWVASPLVSSDYLRGALDVMRLLVVPPKRQQLATMSLSYTDASKSYVSSSSSPIDADNGDPLLRAYLAKLLPPLSATSG